MPSPRGWSRRKDVETRLHPQMSVSLEDRKWWVSPSFCWEVVLTCRELAWEIGVFLRNKLPRKFCSAHRRASIEIKEKCKDKPTRKFFLHCSSHYTLEDFLCAFSSWVSHSSICPWAVRPLDHLTSNKCLFSVCLNSRPSRSPWRESSGISLSLHAGHNSTKLPQESRARCHGSLYLCSFLTIFVNKLPQLWWLGKHHLLSDSSGQQSS